MGGDVPSNVDHHGVDAVFDLREAVPDVVHEDVVEHPGEDGRRALLHEACGEVGGWVGGWRWDWVGGWVGDVPR